MTLKTPLRPALPGALALALAAGTGAADAEEWQATATPYLWLMGSNGELEVRGIETRVDDSLVDMLAGTITLIGGFGIGSNLAANLYALVGYRTEPFGAPVLASSATAASTSTARTTTATTPPTCGCTARCSA